MTEETNENKEEREAEAVDALNAFDTNDVMENQNDDLQNEGETSRSLREALDKNNVELPNRVVEKLNEYCDILWTWNERLNLTRHTSYDKFVARDLIDSMRLAALLQKGEHVLDVGSGGGVPGLIVQILRPDVVVELCESTGKKATALGDIAEQLELDLNVWYAKAEDLLRERRFHTLTVRAVGKMRSLLTIFAPVWNRFNRLLLIKGPNWPAERGEARHYNLLNKLALRKIDEYEIPDAGYNSVILQICRKDRFEEMERRAKSLADGEPYDGEIEELVIEKNRASTRAFDQNRSTSTKKRESNGEDDGQSSRRRQGRNRRETSSSDSQLFARRDGKPPKGWTGKKREFRQENLPNGVKLRYDPRNSNADKGRRSDVFRQDRSSQSNKKRRRREEP